MVNEIGMACSTHGKDGWLENLKGRDHKEGLGVERRLILQWNGKVWIG
jgi:hypothetical protein